jgi:hypothetical protein
VLYHGVGQGELVRHLDDIAEVSRKFGDAAKLANTSGTAGHSVGTVGALEAGEGLLEGNIWKPLGIIGALLGNNVLARVLARPASAKATATWARVLYNKTAGNPRSAAGLQAATRHWAKVVAPDVGVSPDARREHLAAAQEGQGQP